ncbi:MAG: ABC transporter substrate-binding protein, partial [Chloroflexota bacterium]|nr:ABC transporter substrate-binding protein [Chloroflexota bacterium]
MNKRLLLAALVFVAFAALTACATPTAAPTAVPPTAAPKPTDAPKPTSAPVAKLDRNIKIGIVDTYSGPPAAYGNDALNGFKLAVGELNKTGVAGVQIEFVTRDDKYAPDVALSMAKELVLQEKVDVLVGTVNSAAALAISAYAKEQKIPYIVWIAKSENITGVQGHRYVFMTSE